MYTGPLANEATKGHFTGHETFPLRYLWLYKAYEKIARPLSEENLRKNPFSDPDAIVNFGVGKNMVNSIRHWALACNIIEVQDKTFRPTELGDFLFKPRTGHDPLWKKKLPCGLYIGW